jgi:mannose-6-phosphate isomerase-like protein (cupin superfamily)
MSLLQIVQSDAAHEVRVFPRGRFEVFEVAGQVFGRAVYEPGWRWSQDLGQAAGAAWCEDAHVGVVLAGHAAVKMRDGMEAEMGPGDWFSIPPGHDSWVCGDDDYVSLHIVGAQTYAASAPVDADPILEGTAAPVNSRTAEPQRWGNGCQGWTLLTRPSIHVMEEEMAAATRERRHLHQSVSQLYYILSGSAVVNVADTEHPLGAGDAIEIAPGKHHQIRNDSADSLRFLVISSGPPRNDRKDVDEA